MKRNDQEIDRDQWFIPEEKEVYENYLRGADGNEEDLSEVKSLTVKRELVNNRNDFVRAARGAARSEMLKTVDKGYIQGDELLTQNQILDDIPIVIAARKFDFKLDNGPYRADITLNGRTILLGGSGGHFASFDWYTGKKFFELFPEGEVRDVTFLYDDTLSAMATNKLVYIHDKNGVQIHELLDHKKPLFITFLRQHWLLVSASENGRLVYSDVTDGKTVANIRTKRGRPNCMCYNRHNGVVSLGQGNGVVSFWTPNMAEPAATVFTHPAPLTSIDIDISGNKLATAGCDGTVKIWDMRNFDRIYSRTSDFIASSVAFSATGVLAAARGTVVFFYKTYDAKNPFLKNNFNSPIKSLKFVTFDDFAICGLENGISSAVVPGSGEPNIDSNVANPYATKRWRQEQEVRGLLDKIPYDMITMEREGPFKVGRPIDKQMNRAKELEKHRMIKKPEEHASGTKEKRLSMEKRIQMMKEEYNKQLLEKKMKQKEEEKEGKEEQEEDNPLSRFKKAKQRYN
ncbi:WD40-repeat-containing domain protein [Histomonas meleagridis]|uniref:WD40-repeat-containing domain protein n=1 Tax=Histomonas meleagridis TaxID=135588 RepID=UPI003559A03C|nr:WD40-repeat-containing domain protein [Histomonas meleagridis]KAH0803633.1 WD40-repeat-containing domain protein [Histomonas meleagridis]